MHRDPQPPTALPEPLPQVPAFMGAGARHFGFMLRGLRELEPKLAAAGIPFFMLKVTLWQPHCRDRSSRVWTGVKAAV